MLSLCLATGSGADYCLFKSPSSWTVIWQASPPLLRLLSDPGGTDIVLI